MTVLVKLCTHKLYISFPHYSADEQVTSGTIYIKLVMAGVGPLYETTIDLCGVADQYLQQGSCPIPKNKALTIQSTAPKFPGDLPPVRSSLYVVITYNTIAVLIRHHALLKNASISVFLLACLLSLIPRLLATNVSKACSHLMYPVVMEMLCKSSTIIILKKFLTLRPTP